MIPGQVALMDLPALKLIKVLILSTSLYLVYVLINRLLYA
jgi:hypothetical protein